MADLVGQTLGQYRIESVIGSGGMGQVYRGVHVILNRPAAVKVMSATVAADTSFQDRFKREARSAAALSHPNIVEVYDFGEEHGLFYLVMELVPDGSLRTLLRRGGTGAPAPALTLLLELIRQGADALGYAQSQGMVHRDIKPDNLLLQRQTPPPGAPESYALKIADFGLARMMEGDGLTVTGAVLGTPSYMSPEQCLGKALDGRSDLYSLGVVLYEAATGFQPFKGGNPTEVMFKQVNTLPTPPLEVRPDLPAGLDEVIMRCLAKQPDERYQSGTDLAGALARFIGGSPAAAGAAARARPSTQPRRTAPAVGASAATPTQGTRMQAGGPVDTRSPNIPPPQPGIAIPHLRAVDSAGAVLRDVELRQGEVTIGRQPDNTVVLDGDGISRHHAVVAWDGTNVTLTDLNSANGTLLGGVRLLPRDPQRWSSNTKARIGPYWLVLDLPGARVAQGGGGGGETMRTADAVSALNAGGTRPAAPSPAIARVAVGTQPNPDAPARIAVTLDQDALTITPGQVTTCKVTVGNSGALVDHLTIHVEGIPPDWIQQPDPTVQLNPGQQSTMVLTVNVERAPRNRAGTYPVTVRALSRENPADSGAASARWTVLPFYADAIAIRPPRARGRGGARYGVVLTNNGNIPSRVQLNGEDDEEKLRYEFSPKAVEVDAGATSVAGLTVSDKRILTGNPQPPYPFVVKAQSAGGGQSTNGQFVNVPLLPAWVPSRAVMAGALVAAALVYLVAVRPNVGPPFGTLAQATATATAKATATPGQTGPTTCADVSSFNGAQPASPINGFGFQFPVNTVDLIPNPHTETNSYQFEQINACTSSINPQGLRTAYNSLFVGGGWQQSPQFPYSGDPNRGCGDPYCWMKGGSPQPTLFVSLQNISGSGKVTTYQLLLAIAPYINTASLQLSSPANGAALAPSGSTPDVALTQNAQTNGLSLQPQNGATITVLATGVSDLNGITQDQLKSANYTGAAADGTFANGTVYAVKLASGSYTKVLVTNATTAPYTISWVLYQQTF